MKRLIPLILLCIMAIPALGAIRVMSSVNKNTIALDEQVQFTIKVTSDSELKMDDPPAPRISGFSFRNMFTRSSQQISIINLRRQIELSKEYVYVYLPGTTGDFLIPAQSIRIAGNTYSTNPIKIKVVAAGAGSPAPSRSYSPFNPFSFDEPDFEPDYRSLDDVFLISIPATNTIYRGEPVVVSYYLYASSPIGSFQLRGEEDFPGYGKSIFYQPDKLDFERVTYNGRNYTRALIKRIALSPQSTGQIRVPRISGSARLYNYGYQSKAVQSADSRINVLPLPDNGRPTNFSGAVGRFSISESLSPKGINLGDAITYSLVIEGRGNFNQFAANPAVTQPNLKISSPQIVDNLTAGIDGRRTVIYTILPQAAGSYEIPDLSFNWFDSASGRYRVFQSKRFMVEVKPATVFSQFNDLISRDAPLSIGDYSGDKAFGNYPILIRSIIYWLPVCLILIAVIISAMWAREKSLKLKNPTRYAKIQAERQLARHFKEAQAAAQNLSMDFYSLAEKGLSGFIEERYGLSNRLSNAQKLQSLGEMQISEKVIRNLDAFLERCQKVKFMPGAADAASLNEDLVLLQNLVRLISDERSSGI
ncbi:MAG: hypothetical protein CVU49_01230 [Candidatus Cloacimonetes bacterium HGW-Cloacimonetes-2]|jgi:hypothetical protein|nr:MAG: hypothetical protein CVU49_01230 [Candidatus Cloacimonetes bacterium HGW-Cloacimonetes-2]